MDKSITGYVHWKGDAEKLRHEADFLDALATLDELVGDTNRATFLDFQDGTRAAAYLTSSSLAALLRNEAELVGEAPIVEMGTR